MKECKCQGCEKVMVTSCPSERFVCYDYIYIIKVFFEENPHMKPA